MQTNTGDPCPRSHRNELNQKPKRRAKILKVLEEIKGANLCDLGFDTGFLDLIPKVQQQKKKGKLGVTEIKTLADPRTQTQK